MMKPAIQYQSDLFWEDDKPDTRSIISDNFRIIDIYPTDIIHHKINPSLAFRGSLNFAKKIRLNLDFTNCKNWIPVFRNHILSPHSTFFNDLGFFANYSTDFPCFIRPADGFKTFAGQVFDDRTRFIDEYNYLTDSCNYDNSLLCVCVPCKTIDKEWRTVFVDNTFIDGCQYLEQNDLAMENIPDDVVQYAKDISYHPYFINIPNFIIDICLCDGKLHLLEINSFECSSFYNCNLDKIYSSWAKAINSTNFR